MNAAIHLVIDALATDIISLAQSVMDSNTGINSKTKRNTLKESSLRHDIQTETMSSGNQVAIRTLFGNYLNYIEHDRPAKYGKQPPVSSIRDWALSKGIPADNTTLFLICRAIWRDGYKGRPVIAVLEKEIEENFERKTFTKLFEAITEEISNYFN